MELSNWIPILSIALAGATFLVGRLTASNQAGRESGEIKTDIKHIKESVEKIERRMDQIDTRTDDRMDELSQQLVGMGERLSKVEGYDSSAHKRLDEHIRNHKGGTYHE